MDDMGAPSVSGGRRVRYLLPVPSLEGPILDLRPQVLSVLVSRH